MTGNPSKRYYETCLKTTSISLYDEMSFKYASVSKHQRVLKLKYDNSNDTNKVKKYNTQIELCNCN